jgi:antibiotic biosynthesis monooxygenase (ABM) superfamily enzyme
MAVKVLIQRKVKPSNEREFNTVVRELRSKAIHAQGYISGETLCSIDDPSARLAISTWATLEDWNRWADSAERKALQQRMDNVLEEPTKVMPYRYESISPEVEEILTGLEASVQDE